MVEPQSCTSKMNELIRSGALCAVPVGGAGGGGTVHELGPLALLVAGFAGVGVWMFRRYGSGSKGDAPAPGAPRAGAPALGALTGGPAGA